MKHLHEPIYHLLDESGEKCQFFPPSVGKLLDLNGNTTVSSKCIDTWLSRTPDQELRQLVKFYGKSTPGKKLDAINWFLEFSGVIFRYVHG